MRIRLPLAAVMLVSCSGHASKEDRLKAAANQSTPEAANVLAGAAANGMDEEAALNEAVEVQMTNGEADKTRQAAPRYEARPNSAQNPNPPKAGEPVQKVPVNSE